MIKLIEIKEIQDTRIWVHSNKLGYGKWFSDDDFRKMFEIKRNLDENHYQCPYCGNC